MPIPENINEKVNTVSGNDERILVCLSSSPYNQKVIDAAAGMAEAFHAKVLFDTNQMLQKAEGADDVIRITAQQIKSAFNLTYRKRKDGSSSFPGSSK